MKPDAVSAECFECGLLQNATRYPVLGRTERRTVGFVTIVHCHQGCGPSWHVEVVGSGSDVDDFLSSLIARGMTR